MYNIPENEWNSLRRMVHEINESIKASNKQSEKQLLTPAEAWKILKISKATFYRSVESGLIESIKVGSRIKVTRAELNRILENGTYDRSNNIVKSTD